MISVRAATIEDVPKLTKLKEKIGRDTYFDLGTPEQFDAWCASVVNDKYFEDLINNHSTILVAEYEDVFLGMGCVSFDIDFAEFSNLYIGLQDRGIGSLITQHRFNLVNNHIGLFPTGSTYDIVATCFYQNHKAYKHLLKHGFLPYNWAMHAQFEFPQVRMKQTVETPKLDNPI